VVSCNCCTCPESIFGIPVIEFGEGIAVSTFYFFDKLDLG